MIQNKLQLFYFLPLPLIFLSIFIGPSEAVSFNDVILWMRNLFGSFSATDSEKLQMAEFIILNVRLPRICLAFMIGSALTVSGTSFQALFRNPLVSPDILGLSAGAAFGAALALVLPFLPLQATSFVFGLSAVALSYFLAMTRRSVSVVSLILAGIIISGVFTALLTIVQFITDPFKLQTIVHWTMGNLHNAGWQKVKSSLFPIVFGIIWLYFMRWRMNVIALGDEETRAVGLNPEREKILILIPATLIASASVAVAGIIGMVGLAFPHMVKMITGPDNKIALPVSIAFGGSLLLIIDNFSRTVSSFEIPIGIFTTLIGGPFFVYLLKKARIVFRDY